MLHLHGWAALAAVFLVPLLESSTFAGFVFPAEITVVLGGVLASQHQVGLLAVLGAAAGGAVLGDTIGYGVGHHFGHRLLGLRPVARLVTPHRRERAEGFLLRHGGKAVLLGRFTAALRVLIPGMAGMARLPYRTFLPYNVVGGVLWAGIAVTLGYLAGSSWRVASHWFSLVGVLLLGLVLLGALLRHHLRRAAGSLQGRFPRQAAWLARRLDPGSRAGLPLSGYLTAAGLAGWLFAGLTHDVVEGEDLAGLDAPVHALAVAHRDAALTGLLQVLTWLGSNWVLAPVLAAAVLTLLMRRRAGDAALLAVAYLGGTGLYLVVKALMQRPRPPAADLLTAASGWSFPSGHATQAMVGWGTLAVLLAGRAPRLRPWLLTGAALLVLLIGGSRVYLGAHWPTDVLGGWVLGAGWLAVVQAARVSLAGSFSGRPRCGRGSTGPAAGTRTARGGRCRPGSA